jgi:uncharacterized protein DUF2877
MRAVDRRVRIGEVGPIAARAIMQARAGRVVALFERSAYAEVAGTLICIGAPEIGSGPLNAVFDSADAMHALRTRLVPGVAIACEPPCWRLADVVLDFGNARRWQPAAVALPLDLAKLARGVERVRRVARGRTPGDGLARLLARGEAADALGATGLRAARALHAWLAAGDETADVPAALAALIGLGPGLTPSGDDFLGGAVVALHAFGHRDAARRFAAWLLPLAQRETHPVSVAHLVAATEGFGSAALHACLHDAAEAADPRANLERISAIGHTSGWDALAGALAVAEALAVRGVAGAT